MSGRVLDSTSQGTSQAPLGVGAYLPPLHSLPMADTLNPWCIGGFWCPGLGAWCSLPVVAWQGLAPMARSGPFRRAMAPHIYFQIIIWRNLWNTSALTHTGVHRHAPSSLDAASKHIVRCRFCVLNLKLILKL